MVRKTITYIICAALLLFFFGYVATPALQYAESWRTFYYDSDYLSMMHSSIGTGGCIKAFLLQFFAHEWHGAVVMTLMMIVIMLLINALLSRFSRKYYICIISAVVCMMSAVGIASWMSNMKPLSLLAFGNESDKRTIIFMRLSNYVRHEQWDEIIKLCKENRPVNNLLHQNCLNMALAEKGQLGDQLLDEPVDNISSIYVDIIQTPEIAGHLSDIYFSFGHIAQSQRYAFETNEKMNNLSPRMLQRLIETNLIFGQKEVAEKYQMILSKSLYYKDWTPSAEMIAEKRKCIFDDNRFSGFKGLDDDLLQVARNARGTRQCQITLQYLGSLYILAGYDSLFVKMADEFSGSRDLSQPLPKYFQSYYNHLTKE